MPYRADIDGLRALAVLAVVLYHAGMPFIGGGYVGVDVFFVISGFLITSLILHEQVAGTFTLTGFYHRRIRRILPALFAMVAVCGVAGWFLLAPTDYAKLGKSISAAVLSFANLHFWRESGYFDTPVAEKPLLHTWSLGVEEQFYLIFPLFLILVARRRPQARIPLTLLICLLSFAAAAIGAFHQPTATFYLPHTRLWELLAGGLLAMGLLPQPGSAMVRNAAALAGLGLIGIPLFTYSDATIFPGLAALPPVAGAAAIIWSGTGGSPVVGRLLATRPMVFIGKISYSLYLWHFPLLAFGFYVTLGDLSATATAALLALSFVVSVLSWKYIEQPVRLAGASWAWKRVASAAAGAALVLTIAAVAIQVSNGFPTRIAAEQYAQIAERGLRNPDRNLCFTLSADFAVDELCTIGTPAPAPSFVLWGDSHAETLRGPLGIAARTAGRAGLFLGQAACPPVIHAVRPQKPDCREISEAMFRMIVETRSIETVVLAARWGWWAEGEPYRAESGTHVTLAPASAPDDVAADNHAILAASLEQTVAALVSAGKRVWLVGPVPEIGYDVPRYFHLRGLGFVRDLDIAPTAAALHDRQDFVFGLLRDLQARYPLGTILPHEYLCDDATCAIMLDNRVLYSDDDHLSVIGAEHLAGAFAPVFR